MATVVIGLVLSVIVDMGSLLCFLLVFAALMPFFSNKSVGL